MSGGFRQLDYQDQALAALDAYLDLLQSGKRKADEVAKFAASKPHLDMPPPDFPADAWKSLNAEGRLPISRTNVEYSSRRDGCGRPVPNAVLKVPTGGGKTWLAVSSISRIMGNYLNRNAGFALWVVPNESIYTQTLKNLKDRQHPYRQALDHTAAGRVKIMEKGDPLIAEDVKTHLCVMLLMLQSANRQTRETLKMFQDRGNVHGFFPAEGDQHGHSEALTRTPNLDGYHGFFPMVKDSLGNALRMIRPIVVMDEGHRAISELAHETLYGFNPCFVLELTATPKDIKERRGRKPRPGRNANVLVEIAGRQLDREGMIKMPLNLDSRQGTDWRTTLRVAIARLDELRNAAKSFQANTNRYIRPIMLIQVERTGANQRHDGHIHAEDVKEQLLVAGFHADEIAIKTAHQNDLSQPENQDLLSPTNRVRAIITMQALQEGWDCPFAYVLCALAASSNIDGMTQLVGRILRQPGAMKTGADMLDECHVITHRANTAAVVTAIKTSLERDGLGDMVLQVSQNSIDGVEGAARRIRRREKFASTEVYLPMIMLSADSESRELDYETDVLSRIDWRGFDPVKIAASIPDNARAAGSQLQRIHLSNGEGDSLESSITGESGEILVFDPTYAVRMILDIVLNPFIGWEIVERMADALRGRGFDDSKIGQLSGLIIEELRRGLNAERDNRAEALFRKDVRDGRIQFRLRLDGKNWRMPDWTETTEPDNARQLVSRSGGPLQRSLFLPVYENEMNIDERDVAIYLDAESTITWWHRNVARGQYGIQGWRKAKVYPDFIFAANGSEDSKRFVVLETKGDHLDNLDTAYKRELLSFLSDNFAWDDYTPAGKLEFVQNNGETVECALVLMSEWQTKLPELVSPASA